MKRILAVAALVLLLFCGCASSDDLSERGVELRQKILEGKGCSFFAYITADFGDMSYAFSLECMADSEGALTFRVAAPESIEGITGSIDSVGGSLTFNETVLAFPLLAQGELSPVCAPWLFYKGLTGGYLRTCGQEENGLRMTIDDSFSGENLQLDVWTDENDLPKYAEITWQGRRLLSLRIEEFKIL